MVYTDYLPEWEALWAKADMDPERFFALAVEAGRLTIEDYEREAASAGFEPNLAQFLVGKTLEIPALEDHAKLLEVIEGYETPPPDSVASTLTLYFRSAFREAIASLWQWSLEQLKALIDKVVETVTPVLQNAWDAAKGKMEEWALELYKQLDRICEEHAPIKPEDAGPLAAKLYLLAMTAGMGAHGISIVTELLHPLKSLGIHQTAAMVGDFAQFGRIGSAISGPLISGVLQKVIQYAANNKFRPTIPNDRLLVELRSKREIDKGTFDKAMAYSGFNQDWIDAIERWQWKDPRMFEIVRLADVGLEQGSPPAAELEDLARMGITGDRLKDWWLYRKFMRAGYEDVDLPVMVDFIHRREVAFAMTYVRTAIRRNYRWGYLSDEQLDTWLSRLKLPEQAKEWIRWAGDLDRDYFYKQDLVAYYKQAYRNDLIDDDELMVNLVAMGMPTKDVTLTVETEKAMKKPAPSAPVPAPAKKPTAQIQSKYIQLYREQYRRGLIDEGWYLTNLKALGLDPDLAQATVSLEVTKALPK